MNELLPKPITFEDLRRQEREKFRGVTPEAAKTQLETWGYTSDTWETILGSSDRRLGSHDVRLLILIAQGENIFDWEK